MAKSEFVAFVLEQMRGLGPLRAKAMFGGHGLYCEDLFFAIIAEDTLYFKVDDLNRAAFLEAQCVPFVYEAKGKSVTMSYFRAPEEVFDDAEAMHHWAELGIAAARRAAAKKSKK